MCDSNENQFPAKFFDDIALLEIKRSRLRENDNIRVEFIAAMSNILNKGFRYVVVSFEDVAYVNSGALGALIWGAKTLREKKGDIVLYGMNNFTIKVFKYTGFDIMFRFAKNLGEAIKIVKKRQNYPLDK